MTIADKLSHLRAINIETLFDDILRENEDAICDLNRDQLYEQGIVDVNKPNQKLQYAESTKKAKRKAPFNKTDFITLKWTGEFHKALKLIIFKDKFVIASDNKIWGNYIETQTRFQSALGLAEKSKSEVREIARDEMIKKVREGLSTAVRLRA
jgi:hypothetical protein